MEGKKILAKNSSKTRHESNNDFPLEDPSDRVREFKRAQTRVDMHTGVVVRERCFFCFCCWLSFYSIFSSFFSHHQFYLSSL